MFAVFLSNVNQVPIRMYVYHTYASDNSVFGYLFSIVFVFARSLSSRCCSFSQEAFGSFALLLMVFPFNSFLGDTWSAWTQHFFSVMIVRREKTTRLFSFLCCSCWSLVSRQQKRTGLRYWLVLLLPPKDACRVCPLEVTCPMLLTSRYL